MIKLTLGLTQLLGYVNYVIMVNRNILRKASVEEKAEFKKQADWLCENLVKLMTTPVTEANGDPDPPPLPPPNGLT